MSSIDSSHLRRPLTAPEPSVSNAGLFVTFEGGDGGGKSTQIALLEKWFVSADCPFDAPSVTLTKEPGGTELGAKIRELILHSDHVADRAEALLYAADRAHHVDTKIRPALESGGVVLADRYLDSSVAYQGAGRKLDPQDVLELSLWAAEGLLPHVTFLLDISPDALAERRDPSTHDRLERAGRDFHDAVREAFLDLARTEPERWIIIDASQSIEAVHAQITEKLTDWLRAHENVLHGRAHHSVEGAEETAIL